MKFEFFRKDSSQEYPKLAKEKYNVYCHAYPVSEQLSTDREGTPQEVVDAEKDVLGQPTFLKTPVPTKDEKDAMPEKAVIKYDNLVVFTDEEKTEFVLLWKHTESTKYNWGWSSGEETYYGIIRWGEILKSFAELKREAKEKFTQDRKLYLTKEIRRYQREMQDLDIDCIERFGH